MSLGMFSHALDAKHLGAGIFALQQWPSAVDLCNWVRALSGATPPTASPLPFPFPLLTLPTSFVFIHGILEAHEVYKKPF